jgi:5-methyltetrahydropteroyltriglutamate--homocysteine methyltransferase
VTQFTDRILTTHTGSLPRPAGLAADLESADRGTLGARSRTTLAERVRAAVHEAVTRQAKTGIDVVSDGEMSKFGYATYVSGRLTGFGGTSEPFQPFPHSEFADVPGFAPRVAVAIKTTACTGPVTYAGKAALDADLDNLRSALAAAPSAGAFMNAASPGIISDYLPNRFYASHEEYLHALADAMKPEYDAIAAAGFLLQLDCPDLAAGRHLASRPLPVPEFRRRLLARVAVINHALRDIPPERVRVHICWGNYESPHHHDVPLGDIIDLVLTINAGAFLFEAANPRHEHEWQVFRDVGLPAGAIIVPGVIDSLTSYAEHPELVAQRLIRYAEIVGPDMVMAGTDCGFATLANHLNVHPGITWLKLAALVEGARLASDRIYGKRDMP